MEVGQIIEIHGYIVEVCESVNHQCTGCIAVGKMALCRRMPDCASDKYFKKLNNFEQRKLKKQGKIIEKI